MPAGSKVGIKVDEEYKETVDRFYHMYRELQKKYNLRMNSSSGICGDSTIEVLEKKGREKTRIFKVTEDNDIACYKRAIGMLEMLSWKEDKEHEEKAG